MREKFSTWYAGTEQQWQAMPYDERTRLAFAATGCTVAYPTWPPPVDCVHGACRVARGECHPMTLVNGTLKYERQSGWLRFASREATARAFRLVRQSCRERGVYDAWSAWPVIVGTGISGR